MKRDYRNAVYIAKTAAIIFVPGVLTVYLAYTGISKFYTLLTKSKNHNREKEGKLVEISETL